MAKMEIPKSLGGKKGIQDVLSLEFDPEETRCVRMRNTGEGASVLGADLLPAVDLAARAAEGSRPEPLDIPKHLSARYVALVLPSDQCVVKLLNLPNEIEEGSEDQLKEHLGLEEGDFRIGYLDVGKGHGRSEVKVLAVAVDDAIAHAACSMFPVGIPAPASVEIAGLASLTAFVNGPAQAHAEEAVGVIECGSRVSFVAFFFKGELVLIRKFDFGNLAILDRIQQDLGVDRPTAQDIVSDESFDISQSVTAVSESFVKQLVISRHFVERREDCHISKIYVPGGSAISHNWINQVKSALGLDLSFWDPFDAVEVQPDALSKACDGVHSVFSAAIGAGMGLFGLGNE